MSKDDVIKNAVSSSKDRLGTSPFSVKLSRILSAIEELGMTLMAKKIQRQRPIHGLGLAALQNVANNITFQCAIIDGLLADEESEDNAILREFLSDEIDEKFTELGVDRCNREQLEQLHSDAIDTVNRNANIFEKGVLAFSFGQNVATDLQSAKVAIEENRKDYESSQEEALDIVTAAY